MKKKIEEKYKELSEVEHILLRPGMWVGSIKEEEKDMYLYDKETCQMKYKTISYVPAMLKVVDEVISNSCDEYRRKDNFGLTELKISIKDNIITIKDNGGIPVEIHKTANCYVPEFIFGRLRTSSNYNDSEDRNVIGTNGVGSALTNVFSKYFEIETCDGKHKFHRSWSNNMQTLNNDLSITDSTDHYTQTKFELDLSRFEGVNSFSEDFIDVLLKRSIDAAAANPGLKVYFSVNDEKYTWKFNNLDKYIDLYKDNIDLDLKIPFRNELCNGYIFPGSNVDIGFVNGAACNHGTHMKAIRNDINNAVCNFISKKDKIKDLTPRAIDSKYSIFMIIDVSNPSYDSQTKECLTTPIEDFSKNKNIKWELEDRFINKILKSEIIELVRDWYKKKLAAEDQKELRKLNRDASKGLKRSDKYVPANSKKRDGKQLWIYEGDSAGRGLRIGRDPQTQAGYLMRGVPANCLDMTPLQIMKNDVFNDIISILGLKFGEEFDISDLKFDKIVISTDADVDGDKIAALLLLLFSKWPELFEKGIVVRSITPIIIAKKNKDVRKYYSIDEFNKDSSKLKGYMIKYVKGLSGLDAAETKESMRNPIFMNFKLDDLSSEMFKRWFGKDANIRKSMMEKLV